MTKEADAKCYSVLIVGAGVSGLSAAARVAELSPRASVLVLEAGDCAGGRVRSCGMGEDSVEMGAQWIHGLRGRTAKRLKNVVCVNIESGISCTAVVYC